MKVGLAFIHDSCLSPQSEDRCDFLTKELTSTKSLLVDTEEEKKRLVAESSQLKEVCRRELEKSESENSRNSAIISDYKQVGCMVCHHLWLK